MPSGICLNYADLAGQGEGVCPPKTTGFPISDLLTGPMPANGATVTSLYAETNAALTGKDTMLVAVIDNTNGVTLISCAVNSTTKNYCSNTGASLSCGPWSQARGQGDGQRLKRQQQAVAGDVPLLVPIDR